MSKHKIEDIRNVALAGHGAGGKTSLADAILFRAKAVERKGNVDDGTSIGDYDDEEKKRRSTIDTKLFHFEHAGKIINLLDTPGFPDYVGQAICALQGVENALITVNAAHGVEVNTRRMFHEAETLELGKALVITKLDADNIDFPALIENIQATFGKACVLLNIPIGIGPKLTGVASVLNPPNPMPGGLAIDLDKVHTHLVDAIVESDEALMEKYLGGEEPTVAELAHAVPKAVNAHTLIPILCTSAKKDIGIAELLEFLDDLALSPVDGKHATISKDGKDESIEPRDNGEPLGKVIKVINDKFIGNLSFVRLYTGKLTPDMQIYNGRTHKSARSGGMLQVLGKTTKPLTEAIGGDIVAVSKVEDLHLGDTIGHGGTFAKAPFPTPMFGLAIEPKNRGDEQKISGSLAKISEEDPTFKVTRDPQTKELVVSGMSQLHLEVVQSKLKRRYELEVVTHEPKIPYRETVMGHSEGSHRHKKQSGGRGQFGEVHLRVFPLPREINSEESCRKLFMNKERFPHLREDHCRYDAEHNFAFLDSIVGGTIPNQFIPAVYKGCLELLDRGALAGFRMQDVAAEVHFGKDHPVDSSEAAFKTAGRIAFKNTILTSKPVMLEPIVHLEVTVPSKFTGAILGDLNTKRARIENQVSLPGDLQTIIARAPLAEVTRYAAQLGSITQGQGSYTMEFSHYDQVPGNVQQQIVAKVGKISHEDDEE